MKKMIALALAGMIGLPGIAAAQSAMEVAIARAICGQDVRPVAAEFLPDNRLRVVCPPGSLAQGAAAGGATAAGTTTGAGVLAGTALTAGTTAALLGGLVIVAVLVGGDDGTTTTTTTTTTDPS